MSNRQHSRRKLIIISILNSILMLGLAYYWLSLPRTFGDEAFFIKWSSLVRKSLLGFDDKPNPQEVLFIDVSGSKTTIPDMKAFSFMPEAGYHRKVITNRAELAELFRYMEPYRQDIKFVLCDVLFEDTTAYDQQLEASMQRFGDRILAVSHLEEGKKLVQPTIDIPHGLATYRSTSGSFLKFPILLEDSLKTIPTLMHERLDGKKYSPLGPMHTFSGRLSLPSPIVDFKIRPSDFREGSDLSESNYAINPLGTILEAHTVMEPKEYAKFFQNKIILIGDFENDMHATPFGNSAGMLLVFNAYLTMADQQHIIRLRWIGFLFLAFLLLSYRIFADIQTSKPKFITKIFNSRIGQLIIESVDEMVILIIVTLLSYFLFNIHINILILFIYLKLVEWVWRTIPTAAPPATDS
jgi:hypothetical protein